MGRPSKLSDRQWAEVEKRLLAGDKPADLAREFKVDRAQLTRRFSQPLRNVKTVAQQVFEADVALKSLPVAQQALVLSLADELKAISSHLASASKYGAMTSHRLLGIAHQQSQLIDDAEPMGEQSMEAIKGIRALAVTANESSLIARDLLKANKETIDGMNKADDKPKPSAITYRVI